MPQRYRRPARQARILSPRFSIRPRMRAARQPLSPLNNSGQAPTGGQGAGMRPSRLGHYLKTLGLVSEAQLAQALVEQERLIAAGTPMALGDVLVAQKALTSEDLVMAIMLQQLDRVLDSSAPMSTRLGELLVRSGVITAAQFASALMIQLQRRRQGEHVLLGQILVAQGLLAPDHLSSALREQNSVRAVAEPPTC